MDSPRRPRRRRFVWRLLLTIYVAHLTCVTASQEKIEDEVVFWHCKGAPGDDGTEKRGYYLQFSRPGTIDISSTSLRRVLNKDLCANETQLNQLSVNVLLDLLAPMLAR